MKKTLIYGALGGVALYLYLQIQKKKKLSAKETPTTKQDDTSGTGGIKKINPMPFPPRKLGDPTKRDNIKKLPVEVPLMLVNTPKGEGDGFSVKNDAPTPPAPTVEPVIIPQPPILIKPVIKPKPQPKPIFTKPDIIKSVIQARPVIKPKPQPKPIFTKPDIIKSVIQARPVRPVVMPQPKPFIPKSAIKPKPKSIFTKPVIKPRPIATDRPIVKPPMPIKPVVPKGRVDIEDFVIPRLKKRPTGLIR